MCEKKVISDSLLSDFQHLSGDRYGFLRSLAQKSLFKECKLEHIIEEMAIKRYKLGLKFYESTKSINTNSEINARNIISRNYYGMYQAARAVVFYIYRYDEDDHEKTAKNIGKILGGEYHDFLNEWRKHRNTADYSPFPPENLIKLVKKSLKIAKKFIIECGKELQKRGVKI